MQQPQPVTQQFAGVAQQASFNYSHNLVKAAPTYTAMTTTSYWRKKLWIEQPANFRWELTPQPTC